jgi:hypothetical protein
VLSFRRSMSMLLLLAAAGTPAAAQNLADYDYENLAFRGAGVSYGYIWPDKVRAAPVYSLRFDLGYLGPGVRIAPSIGYWTSTVRESELERLARQLNALAPQANLTGADLGPIEWSDLSLSVDAHLVWTTPVRLMPFVGLGLGIHALNGQGPAINDTFIEDLLDSVTTGAVALAGLEFEPFSRLRLWGEVRFTLMSDLQYPGVRAGAAFMFPPIQAVEERR